MYTGLALLLSLASLCSAPPPLRYEDRIPQYQRARSGLQRPLSSDPSSFSLIRNGLSLPTQSEPENLSEDPYPHSSSRSPSTHVRSKHQIVAAKSSPQKTAKAKKPKSQQQRQHAQGHRIPTPLESARLARKILDSRGIGTLSTVFPSFPRARSTRSEDIVPPFPLGGRYPDPRKNDPNTPYSPPSIASSTSSLFAETDREVPGAGNSRKTSDEADENDESLPVPIGLPDYYASDCEPERHGGLGGDPTILAVSIATAIRNARGGSNVTLSVGDDTWTPATGSHGKDGEVSGLPPDLPHYPAAHPRFALIGYLEPIFPPTFRRSSSGRGSKGLATDSADSDTYADDEARALEKQKKGIEACFLEKHPDARVWTPGNDIHESWWARLVVTDVYWFGGFGDRAYIGWLGEKRWREAGRRKKQRDGGR